MPARKLAVITGGASGIGEATARRFAADGFAIAIVDLNKAAGEAVAKSIQQAGGDARFYPGDVSDAQAMERLAAAVEKDMGAAEALVTAAGLIPNSESIMDMDLEAHDRMWRVNYNGTIYSCRAFARPMIAKKRGAIVTIGSINSRLPLPQLLAVELGRHGIRVNSVAPTYVMTPPLRAKVESGARDMNKIMAVHALDRLPEPKDIADGIAYLCSDQAASITGVLLPIDAGWLAAVSYRTYAGGVPWKE
jgi:NAD(P)-dependent dehydrogenase (short-subunit alcohol dehydrogenase family)